MQIILDVVHLGATGILRSSNSTTAVCTEIPNLVLVLAKMLTYCLNMETHLSSIISKIKELRVVVIFYIWKWSYYITICDDFHEIENVPCFYFEWKIKPCMTLRIIFSCSMLLKKNISHWFILVVKRFVIG